MKHGKRLVALFMSLSLIANHTSTVIALGDEYKRLFIEQSLNAPNITWDTKDEVIVGTAFDSMKGVKAIDDKGNDITDKVKVTGSVDTSKEGEYVLTYSIVDSEEEPITRVVRVIPNPEFNVSGSDYVRTYKGEEFDHKQGLTVTDSKGNDITSSVTCEGNVDINKLGSYNLKYYVPDKKEPILERTVDVIEKNVFNVYLNNEKLQKSLENYNNWLKDPNKDPNKPVSIEKDLAFSIYLDNKTSKFALENQSSEKLDVSIGDEVFANIKVFDKDNKEKLSIELLGSDTGNSEKLDKLKELTYEYGDYISIVTRDSKNCLDITGTLTGDIDNTKEDCKEYYSDGVDNLDYIKNVRFNIVKEGIKTVYNNAPVITGLTEMEKLLTTRDEQLKGISITDDKDTYIPLDEVVITEEKDGDNIIGLRYTVCDDWGREASGVRYLKNPQTNDGRVQIEQSIQTQQEQSSSSSSTLNISPKLKKPSRLSDNFFEVLGVTYPDNDLIRFKIKFDIDNMEMYISEADNRLFDNKFTGEYFRLEQYSKDGVLKSSLVLNGNDRADSEKIRKWDRTKFAYGDQLKIYHKYTDTRMKIGYDVLAPNCSDNWEDYSGGIPTNIQNESRFEITRNCLKRLVNKPPKITWSNEKLIIERGKKPDLLADITVKDDIDGDINRARVKVTPLDTSELGPHTITYSVTDSWGATYTTQRTVEVVSTEELSKTHIDIYDSTNTNKIFTIGFDDFSKRLSIKNTTSVEFDSKNKYDTAFRIRILSKKGVTKKDIELFGKDTGESSKLKELNNYKYSVDDYIEIRTTTSKAIRIIGKVSTEGSAITDTDFSNGLDTKDLMDNTRFQLNAGQMKIVYNEAPSIEFNDAKFARTDKFNPAIFVGKITDDHDNNKDVEGKLKPENVRAEYDEEEIYNLGKHSVKFILADTWGREYTTTTTIETVSRNKLEKVNIDLMKVDKSTDGTLTSKSTIATLYFDDVKKKIVPVLNKEASIDGQPGQKVFTILIYGSDNKEKYKLEIDINTKINQDTFKELSKVSITKGDYIHIEAYSPDAVCISGQVVSTMNMNFTDYSNGFKDFDKMKNTMFEIQEEGLTALYNEAPHITWKNSRVYQGDSFDVLSDITITDDRDTKLTTSMVTVVGDTTGGTTSLDTTKIGVKTITYKITDSWGRTALIQRSIFVRSNLEKAKIEIKDNKGQTAIILQPDSVNMKLSVEFNEANLPLNKTTRISNTTEVSLALYNEKNEHIGTLDILGNDNKNEIEKKLTSLTTAKILRGSKIHIDAKNTTQVSITGIVSATGGNITTGTVDFSEGNYDKEYLDNSVFKLVDDGIEVLYNQAPSMNLTTTAATTTPLTLYKGDDYRQNLLDAIEVIDELEVDLSSKKTVEIRVFERTKGQNTSVTTVSTMPTTSQVAISTSSNVPLEINTTGSYVAYYTVKDSWDEKCPEILVKDFDIVPSIDRNIINLGGPSGIDKRRLLTIGFDSNTKSFKIKKTTDPNINSFNSYVYSTVFYKIYLCTSQGQTKLTTPIVVAGDYDFKKDSKGYFRQLEKIKFEYGDYIQMDSYQVQRMSIEGPVRNPVESDGDYATPQKDTQGIYEADKFKNTRFYITEEGLDAKYISPVELTTGRVLVDYDGLKDGSAIKLLIDSSSGTISVPNINYTGFFNYPSGDIAFTVNFNHNSDKQTFTFKGADRGSTKELEEYLSKTRFVEGDYIEFRGIESRKKSISLVGDLEVIGSNEDYSDGVDNLDNLNNVRFYFRDVGTTNAHIEAVYNKAPEFKGVDEVNFYIKPGASNRDYYPFDTTSGVSVVDDNTTDITFSVTGVLNNRNEEMTNGIPAWDKGEYKCIYNTTDSWGRVTEYTRKIYVRPNGYKNKIMIYPKTTSDTTTSGDNVVITSDSTAAFKIAIDDRTDRYKLVDRKDVPINSQLGDNPAFGIVIYDNNGTEKKRVILNGNDTGTSEKLDELTNTPFGQNDYIRVWSADPRYLAISGDITKDSQNGSTESIENFNDGIQEPVYMNNTAFKINDNRMTYIYNEGAKITTTRQTLDYKSNISDNLVDLVTITDDKSTTSEMTISYEGSIDTNKVGIYPVTYTVVDSWGRTVEQTINFEVAPNYGRNRIEVYSNDGTHMFDIGFDTYHNKLSVNQITTTKTSNTSSGNYLKIVVRDNNAKITNTLEINETDFTSQGTIEKIKQIGYVNNGFISFESSSPSSIRITGNITASTAVTRNINTFEDGFDSLDQMKNSRFMLKPEGLKLITKETPVITFKDTSGKTVTSTSITRGDDSNLYDSIDLGFKQPENYLGISYSSEGLDKYKFGKQNVTFMVNDSWGTTTVSTTAVVDVKDRNYLEGRIIQIKDGTDEKKNLATLRFDTIENKIIPFKTNVKYNRSEELLLTFKLYDKNGITKKVKRITKYNITSSETLEKLFEDVYFEDGDRISLESYDNDKGIAIYGNIPGDVTTSQEIYSDGVQNPDYIDNVRFEIDKSDDVNVEGTIREYSLKSVYNHAPEMTFDKEFKAYKGIEPNFFDGVNVTDSDIHDKDINIEDNVQIDTEFDPDILGDQKVDYIATDTWGRQTSTEKTVTVESGLLSNRIEYYTSDSSTEPLFYVYLDKTNNKLKVNSSYSTTKAKNTTLKTEPFKLTLYYSENSTNATTRATIKKELEITTDETLDSIKTKLNDFNNTAFKYGEYLGVYAKDHKNDIKIKGQINQPLRITEDYSEGITTADFMNNVKFKITEEELMAIYNEAPEMILPTDSTLVYYKGDKIFPGEGAIVRDDIDLRLTVEDVYISEEEEKKFDTMGTTMVSVTVTDYWGRSTQGERKIEVRNALTRNELIFGGYNNTGGEKRQKFKLVFDTTHKTIYITGKDAGKMNDQRHDTDYYNIKLYDGDTNKVKFNYDVPAQCDPTETSFGSLEVTNTSHGVSYEQGDYFKFNGPQVFRMSIDGAVRNELENYENGVNMSANFIDTRFYIEDSGLRAEFQNSMPITTDESLIEFNVGKGKPLRMKVDHNTGQVTFGKSTDYFDYNNNAIVFKLNWYTKDDSTMHTFSFDGWDSGNGSGSRELKSFAQKHPFKQGDYITFETPGKKFHKRIELSGKIIKPTTPDVLLKDEDFSDGIDYEENMLRTEFHYNKDGVKGFTIFKKAPAIISGAEDISIPQNSNFDITSGVTAKDYDNADLTSAMTITVNDGTQVRSGYTLDTSKVGPQEVVYRVTNRAGITSAVYRNINVYSVPGFTTKADVAPLEQGSIKKDSEELKEYLLSLVTATDTDDGDITSKVTVTSDIDPEKAGTYKATYSVTNSFGRTTTLSDVKVEVVRTISVDVPIKVPFQIVTNLINKDDDPFVAGTLNLRNNKTSDVKVSLDGFIKKNSNGGIEIVTPGTIDWDNLTTDETMKKMALGIYNKEGFKDSSYSQKSDPLWLHTGITSTTIGTLERAPSLTSPSTAKIGFTSKHGKKFIGGTTRGKFELRFKFE